MPAAKPLIESNATPSIENSRKQSAASQCLLITSEFQQCLNQINAGKLTDFHLDSLRNCNKTERMSCARMVIKMARCNPKKADLCAIFVKDIIICGIPDFALNIINFCDNELEPLSKLDNFDYCLLSKLQGIGVFMANLYNSDCLRKNLIIKLLKIILKAESNQFNLFRLILASVSDKLKVDDVNASQFFAAQIPLNSSSPSNTDDTSAENQIIDEPNCDASQISLHDENNIGQGSSSVKTNKYKTCLER